MVLEIEYEEWVQLMTITFLEESHPLDAFQVEM